MQVGAAIVATRFALDTVTPGALAMLRYAIGAACLAPAFLATVRRPLAGPDRLPVALLGIAQFGLLVALLNAALVHISAARAALIFATLPVLTILAAAAWGRERITATRVVGALVCLGGVALALSEELADRTGAGSAWLGGALALASAVTGAVCSVLYRPYLERYPTVQIGFIAMLASVVALAGVAASEGFFHAWPEALQAASAAWAAIVFIGASSGVGYMAWLYALRHADAGLVTQFLSLSPVTAALLGALLLGEQLTPGVVAGLVAVLAGLWTALRRAR